MVYILPLKRGKVLGQEDLARTLLA